MAEGGGVGSVLKWGLVAGAAYFLYDAITGAKTTGNVSLDDLVGAINGSAQSPAGTVPAATAPPRVDPVVKAAILRASGNDDNSVANADQWNYYRNVVTTPLTDSQWAQAFPGMTPTDRGPQMTVEQFLSQISTNVPRLIGLASVSIPVPVLVQPGGQRVLVWAAKDGPGGVPRIAVFRGANPLVFGVRPLPASEWRHG